MINIAGALYTLLFANEMN